jgi:hypothetical protein
MTPTPEVETEEEIEAQPRGEVDTLQNDVPLARGFVYQYRYVILISIIFIALSIYYALTYFPELSTLRAVIAGLGFGIFCSMCAATYSQLI